MTRDQAHAKPPRQRKRPLQPVVFQPASVAAAVAVATGTTGAAAADAMEELEAEPEVDQESKLEADSEEDAATAALVLLSVAAATPLPPSPPSPSLPPAPPYIPPTWKSSEHPTARPPSPVPTRTPRMSSTVVDRVLERARNIDPDAELASASFTTDGQTLVRVRVGVRCSIHTMQQCLNAVMPLCGSEVVDSPLDGTTELGIVVPTAAQEKRAARNLVRRWPVTRITGHLGFLLFFLGFASWVLRVIEMLMHSDGVKDEL